jgi:hypothetical protein
MARRNRGRGGPSQGQRAATQERGGLIRGTPTDLGDISGEVVEPVLATFVYFGKEIRVNPDLTEAVVIDLIDQANGVEAEEATGLMAGAKDYVRGHIHPDDFDTFWEAANDNRQGLEARLKVCWRILEMLSERPTTPPSDSSDGRPTTQRSLPAGASALDVAESPSPRLDGVSEVAARWIDRYEAEGRPDLAAQVLITARGKEAALAQRTG